MSGLTHLDEAGRGRRDHGDIAATWTYLGEAAGSVTVGLRRIEIDPGRRSTPAHIHGAEEEIFYVLAGDGLLWQDGATCAVGAGDCIVHLPERGVHTLRAGAGGLDVLAFGSRRPLETCYLPRAGRMWAGPAQVLAELAEMYALDDAAGPFPFPEPGPRFPNVVALADVEEDTGGEGDCRFASRPLGRAAGSVATGLNHERVPAGMIGCPPHCHGAEEELFVVLEGDGTLELGDERIPLRAGHVVSRPAGTGVAHAIRGGDGGITYLSYGTREPNDIALYPRSGKVYLRGVKVMGRIEPLGYWDGER